MIDDPDNQPDTVTPTDEQTKKPERENRPEHSSSTHTPNNEVAEERSDELQKELMKKPRFRNFDSIAYLELFYKPLHPELTKQIIEIFMEMEQTDPALIDLQAVRTRLSNDHAVELEPEMIENYWIIDRTLRKALPAMLVHRPEDSFDVLDAGGGSTMYQHALLVAVAKSITHAEYDSQNQMVVKQWLKGQPIMRKDETEFSWNSYFETAQNVLGQFLDSYATADPAVYERIKKLASGTVDDMAAAIRDRLHDEDVVDLDVFRPDLSLPSTKDRLFDVAHVGPEGNAMLVTSNFCVESATPSLKTWVRGVENVIARISPGGFFLTHALRNSTWYPAAEAGEEPIPATPITEDYLRRVLEKRGFEILELQVLIGSDKTTSGYDGMISVLARKKGLA